MKTYFDVGGERFESMEGAVKWIGARRADTTIFHVHEVANAQVTRKTAKGNVITELVRGNLDAVPRISAKELSPTYLVRDTDAQPLRYESHWIYFTTRVDAENARAQWQSTRERLATLTEDDIKEVHVLTLADILERDADKIEELGTEVGKAREELTRLEEQAGSCVAEALADLERQADVLKAEAAKRFGVGPATEKFLVAVGAYHEVIHFDELEESAREQLHEDHESNCWRDSGCRKYGECNFEPDSDDVETFLLDHAEEFEVEEEEVIEQITVQVTRSAEKLWSCAEMKRKESQHLGTLPLASGQSIRIYARSLGPSTFCDSKRTWRVSDTLGVVIGKSGDGETVLCDHQIDHEAVCSEAQTQTAGAELKNAA